MARIPRTCFTNSSQEFYIRLSEDEQFGIAKLTVKGEIRIVEELTIDRTTKEISEAYPPSLSSSGNWPSAYSRFGRATASLREYAVIQYTPGKPIRRCGILGAIAVRHRYSLFAFRSLPGVEAWYGRRSCRISANSESGRLRTNWL